MPNGDPAAESRAGAASTRRLTEYDAYPVPIREIWSDHLFNHRDELEAADIRAFADSVQDGLQVPVVLQPVGEVEKKDNIPPGVKWRLIAGFRRTAAALMLGWETIPARVVEGLSEHEASVFNFRENLDRKNLNILEEAMALKKLWPYGATLKEMADELGRDIRWVSARVHLLKMPAKVREFAKQRKLSKNDIEELSRLDFDEQLEAAKTIIECKKTGKSKPHTGGRPPVHARVVKRKREIVQMTERMLKEGITGLAPLALAWASGGVPNDELIAAIEEAKRAD